MIEDARLKVDRARIHREELARMLSAHQAEYPPQIAFRPGSLDNPVSDLEVTVKNAPKMASSVIGDTIHNLRAALDVLAVQLVEQAGGDSKGVCFPFAGSEPELAKIAMKRGFHQAGAQALEVLRKAQPYRGGNLDLRALHDLDIQDKHRAIIPVSNFITTPQIQIVGDFPDVRVELVQGSEAEVSYVFPDDAPLAGEEINASLERLEAVVLGLIVEFEATVPG